MRRPRALAALLTALVLAGAAGCGGSAGGPENPNPCPATVQSSGSQFCSQEALNPPAGKPGHAEPIAAPQAARTLGLGLAPLTTSGSNGNLPSSAISAATGCSVGLATNAAAAWNHVAVVVHDHTGYWLQSDGSASCYRTFAQQVALRNYWCGQGNCANAAVPGTSNHGWGLAVDGPPQTVADVHRYGGGLFGQGYGSCSDAPWESWHIKYCGGYSGPDPGPYGQHAGPTFNVLNRGDKGKRVKTLSTHLALLRDAGHRRSYLRWRFRGYRYDKPVAYAVRKLQHDGRLGVDGIYGRHTARYQRHRWRFFCAHHKKPC